MNLNRLMDSKRRIKDSEYPVMGDSGWSTVELNQKQLIGLAKALNAYDVTKASTQEMYDLVRGKTTIAKSFGNYGANGVIFEKGGKYYAITARNTNLAIAS